MIAVKSAVAARMRHPDATLHTALIAAGRSGAPALQLRERIDALTLSPMPAMPVSQTSGD